MQVLAFALGVMRPWILIGAALFFLPVTIFRCIVTLDWRSLTSLSRFKDAWFARVWLFGGPLVRKTAAPRIGPLLAGRIRSGIALPAAANSANSAGVHGTVIEVGPGSGMWVHQWADAGSAITRVYGVEPNADLHPALRQRVRDAGLEDKYEIVPVGIEDIGATGMVQKGSVDAIVTLMCLCCIPEPEKNIKELYEYLKPGGRWYFYEHVRTFAHQGSAMRSYQALINRVWLPLMGGCDLCRDSVASVRAAGPWADIDLASFAGEDWWTPAPHAIGTLTKA